MSMEETAPDICAEKYSRIMCQPKCKLQEECSICLQTLFMKSVNYLPCKHIFHADCLNQAFKSKLYTCPLCRHNLVIPLLKTGFVFPPPPEVARPVLSSLDLWRNLILSFIPDDYYYGDGLPEPDGLHEREAYVLPEAYDVRVPEDAPRMPHEEMSEDAYNTDDHYTYMPTTADTADTALRNFMTYDYLIFYDYGGNPQTPIFGQLSTPRAGTSFGTSFGTGLGLGLGMGMGTATSTSTNSSEFISYDQIEDID